MADNYSIAFQIYKTIEEKQNELIKKNAIKPEDIQELSEESFIKELQASVNFHTKNISKKSVISEIYKEILKQVDRISDISQITTSSGIKLPDEMIREGVKLATERTKIENVDNNLEINNNFISQFNVIESLDEKISFYESLSDNEKEAIRKDVYTDLFGEETADKLLSQETDSPCEKSEHYNELEPENQEGVKEIVNSNNIVTYIMKNLGINVDKMHINLDMAEMGFVISRLKHSMDKNSRIDENASKEVLRVLIRKMNFSEEKAREVIRYFEEKYKEDPKFYADISEFKKHRVDTMQSYNSLEEKIKDFLQQKGIPYNEAVRDTFCRSFDKDGKLNIDAVIVNFELLQYDKVRYFSIEDLKTFKRIDMKNLKEDMRKFFDSKSINTNYQNIRNAKSSNLRQYNPESFEEIKRKKIEEGYEEKISSNDKFDEFLKADKLDIERNLLSDFSLGKMSEMITDIYGSEFAQSMMVETQRSQERRDPFKRIEEGTLDFIYGIKAEELIMKEELPTEKKTEMPMDIVPEILDFNAGNNFVQAIEDKKTSSTTKIADIRGLIERQGHMKDILETIGKVSEIGKNGINSVEQEKNVDGEKTDDQKTSAPSDEEKE